MTVAGSFKRASDVIVSDIRRQIVSGDMSEGQALPSEAALMGRYGVSRPTVREAWRILESEGLITVRRGALGGAIVHTPSEAAAAGYVEVFLERRGATLADVHRSRELIESAVAQDLAVNHGDPGLEALRQHVKNNADGGNDVSACMAGVGFHRALVVASGNKTLMLYQSLIAPVVDRHITRYLGGAGSGQTGDDASSPRITHLAMVSLLASGDAALARDFWVEHLRRLEGLLDQVKFSRVTDLRGA